MIIIDCPHCKMRLAISRAKARMIASEVMQEELRGFSEPPLKMPHLDLKGEIEPGDTDLEFLRGIGVKP